jgi:hypothetical protein
MRTVPEATQTRRLLALFCLVAVLFAALAPGASPLPAALLAPLWLFFWLAVCLSICESEDTAAPPLLSALARLAPRAPPRA